MYKKSIMLLFNKDTQYYYSTMKFVFEAKDHEESLKSGLFARVLEQ